MQWLICSKVFHSSTGTLGKVVDHIKSLVLEEAEQYLGMSMTYSLFEYVKAGIMGLANKID